MLVGVLLNSLVVFVFALELEHGRYGPAGIVILFLPYLIFPPILGWIFARRGPFALVALAAILMVPVLPVWAFSLTCHTASAWDDLPISERVASLSVTVATWLFPLWIWTMWQTAMPPDRQQGRRGAT